MHATRRAARAPEAPLTLPLLLDAAGVQDMFRRRGRGDAVPWKRPIRSLVDFLYFNVKSMDCRQDYHIPNLAHKEANMQSGIDMAVGPFLLYCTATRTLIQYLPT